MREATIERFLNFLSSTYIRASGERVRHLNEDLFDENRKLAKPSNVFFSITLFRGNHG
jgi:hypothetical protein